MEDSAPQKFTCELVPDTSLTQALDELVQLFCEMDLPTRQRLCFFFSREKLAPQLFVVDDNAADAANGVVRLKPSEGFTMLLSALRTGDIDRLLVKH